MKIWIYNMGRWWSGLSQQTVNLSPSGFGGSNPSLPTNEFLRPCFMGVKNRFRFGGMRRAHRESERFRFRCGVPRLRVGVRRNPSLPTVFFKSRKRKSQITRHKYQTNSKTQSKKRIGVFGADDLEQGYCDFGRRMPL